jgi:hypothetical protein
MALDKMLQESERPKLLIDWVHTRQILVGHVLGFRRATRYFLERLLEVFLLNP